MKLILCYLLHIIFTVDSGSSYTRLCATSYGNVTGFLHSFSSKHRYRARKSPYIAPKEALCVKTGAFLGPVCHSKRIYTFAHDGHTPVEPQSTAPYGSAGDDKLLELRRQLQQRHGTEFPLREHYIKGTGPGGQKVNKSSNCVQLIRFSPALGTNIVIKCHVHRSLLDNRIEATRILLRKLDEAEDFHERALRSLQEKEKRRILRLTPAEKARKKFEKQLRSEKKANRRRWKPGEEF
ncbi:peptide chain release factor [Babesia ovis]|uniref:Peptide chain release factor n=1 Tax=Babesia ovis TaxID=5869 RepID=A0A9W5TC46_BABOV|nr:peptide chain release factor [Babesia ovis]